MSSISPLGGVERARRAESILGSHALVEGLVEEAGVEWTFLRPGGFAANTRMWAGQIKDAAAVRWFHGAMVRPLIHERDIADVGVSVLTAKAHGGARYVLTGPEPISQRGQVAVIGEAIGRTVRWIELSLETARDELLAQGIPESFADDIIASHTAMLDDPESVTETVETIIGTPARTFRTWAVEHAGDFR